MYHFRYILLSDVVIVYNRDMMVDFPYIFMHQEKNPSILAVTSSTEKFAVARYVDS